jgi:hypothetical protein
MTAFYVVSLRSAAPSMAALEPLAGRRLLAGCTSWPRSASGLLKLNHPEGFRS